MQIRQFQFTSESDKFTVYVSREEKLFEKKQCVLDTEARTSIKECYKAAQDLCQAQIVFMEKTKAFEAAVKDENIFLDIIRQVQLPAVQVMVRMRKRRRGAPRQDIPGAVADPTPPQLPEAETECNRYNKNQGHIHLLCFVQTAYRQAESTAGLLRRVLMSDDSV